MPYSLEFVFNINPHSIVTETLLQKLKAHETQLLQCLTPVGMYRLNSGAAYFHPDDESELRGVEFVCWEIHIRANCRTIREVPFVIQIAQGIAGLFDDPDGTGCSCRLLKMTDLK